MITIALAIVTTVIYKSVIIDPLYKLKSFPIDKSVDTIFAGASHTACAFCPEYYPNSINIGRSGEPVFFTYFKLQKLLNDNKQIKQVIIAFDPIHISKYQDNLMYKNTSNSRNTYLDYFFLLHSKDYSSLQSYTEDFYISWLKYELGIPFSYLRDIKLSYKEVKNIIKNSDYNFWGGQEKKDEVHLDNKHLAKKIAVYFNFPESDNKFSETSIQSIEAIASLCDQKRIKLTLIRTPLYKKFSEQIPKIYTDKFSTIINSITKKHKNVACYDLSNLNLPKNIFLDGDHLNTDGSKIFTSYIKDNIR